MDACCAETILPANEYGYTFYSVRKLLTGFAKAAFIAWKLTVSDAINKAKTPANTKTHHPIEMR